MKTKGKEIGLKERCPCSSGKFYKNCCHGKRFKWVREKDGSIARVVPMHPHVKEAFDSMDETFLRIFERKPRREDPVFIWQYLYSDRDVEREMIETMERAGIDPAKIYAYKETDGLIVSRDNLDLLPDKDIAEWQNAIDEYYDLLENPSPIPEEEEMWESFIEELANCIIVFGYILEHGGNSKHKQSRCASRYINFETYAILCATRCFKTLRFIRYLLDKEIGDDCLSLARNTYENYLHIIYTKANPNKLADLVDAIVGLKRGTHEYKKNKDGCIDVRKIIDKLTGQQYEGRISNYRMAEASEFDVDRILFSYIYEFLSEYTHPSFNTAHLMIGKSGKLDLKVNELQHEALLYSLCFSCMVLDEIRLLPSINEEAAIDIQKVSTRISRKAVTLLEKYLGVEREHFRVLIERLTIVGIRKKG